MSSSNTEKSCFNCSHRMKSIEAQPCRECKPGVRDKWRIGKEYVWVKGKNDR